MGFQEPILRGSTSLDSTPKSVQHTNANSSSAEKNSMGRVTSTLQMFDYLGIVRSPSEHVLTIYTYGSNIVIRPCPVVVKNVRRGVRSA